MCGFVCCCVGVTVTGQEGKKLNRKSNADAAVDGEDVVAATT